jgi:hypothetical protein
MIMLAFKAPRQAALPGDLVAAVIAHELAHVDFLYLGMSSEW